MLTGLLALIDGEPLVGAALRLLLAALLGGAIGLEREIHDKPAGFRTHVLVCLGSALAMIVSTSFSPDSSRIAAQVISGIGFLGAGTIIRRGDVTVGLTTAASLWAVAGLGLAAGHPDLRFGLLAVVATGLVLLTLIVFGRLETWLPRRPKPQALRITVAQPSQAVSSVTAVVERLGGRFPTIRVTREGAGGAAGLELELEDLQQAQVGPLLQQLSELPGVQSVRLEPQ